MTGWGQDGPLAHKADTISTISPLTGALHAMGTKEKPAVPLNLIADFGGGALYLALGVLSALHHARNTGNGQVVDAAMTDGVVSLMGMIYGDFAAGRWLDERESNPIDGAAPFYNVYRCADGRWLSVAALEPPFYRSLLQVLADAGCLAATGIPQRVTQQWQRETWPGLQQALAQAFGSRARDEWCALFADHDACVAPVLSLAEAQQHPHNLARKSFVTLAGIAQPAAAPRLSITPGAAGLPPHSPAIAINDALRRWNT